MKNFVIGMIFVEFEFVLDYVVVKIFCWLFDKFENGEWFLGMQMKVIGEVMVIGWNIEEFLLKVVCFLEIGIYYIEFFELVDIMDDDLI